MAMSLGRHRGPALIGKPLDISVQAVLDVQDDVAGLCLEADVFYAESKVDRSRVRVGLTRPSPGSTDAVITIRSTALVDEPVVTVYLRSGCQQKNERRYVLLADLVSDTVGQGVITSSRNGLVASEIRVPLAPDIVPGPGSVAADSTALRQTPWSPAARLASASVSVLQSSPDASRPAKTEVQKPTARSNRQLAMKPVTAGVGRNRLKLEPLDLSIERSLSLRVSPELLSVPAANEQDRSVAAALWKALRAQPEDILKNTERLRELESSVASLRSESQKNKRSINELNGDISKAQSERFANSLVYSLLGLFLIALAGIVFLWRKQYMLRDEVGEQLPWWRKAKLRDKEWSDSTPERRGGIAGQAMSSSERLEPGQPRKRAGQVELDLDLGNDDLGLPVGGYTSIRRGVDSLHSLPSRDRADFALSMTHMARAVKAEELFDVQQQADFFLSLGQHEQAIGVLREHINGNVQTSALVYLDLFNLYHLLKCESDYEELRGEFSKLFNAKMPEFSLYSDASPGLEAYPAALDRIVTLWRSPRVLDVIEEWIFRKVDAHSEVFDLGAYRELLLLYAIAKEVANFEPGDAAGKHYAYSKAPVGAASPSFASTSVQPLSVGVSDTAIAGEGMPIISVVLPKPSPRLGLDVDLSDIFGDGPAIKFEVRDELAIDNESDSHFFAQFANEPMVATVRDTKGEALPSLKVMPHADNLMDFENLDALILPSRRL
jgi:hypothetical protein